MFLLKLDQDDLLYDPIENKMRMYNCSFGIGKILFQIRPLIYILFKNHCEYQCLLTYTKMFYSY